MSEARIIREDNSGLCTLTLNRPDKLNALDTQTFVELDAILAALEAEADRIGCVVLRGTGRAFCAGADLQGIAARIDRPDVDPWFKPNVIERLAALPQPVIAGVHGVCFTGGLELALACDFILADDTARFADTHGKWGLVGMWGIMQRLPRRIGEAAARRMMMTSCHVGAEEAGRSGLADRVVGDGELDEAVASLAADILANSWHTNFAVKRTLRETSGIAAALEWERENYPGLAPDHAERVAGFTKK